MTFLEVEAKTALNRVRGMPFPWSINPYRGCSHACSYCFARPSHAYLNLSPLGDFERTVVVKTNLVEVLERELARPSWKGEHVAMGTNTDPYQRCEGRYRLMPGIVSALGASRTPFSILTKGTLVTRDLPALRAAAERVPVSAALTIGMLDEAVWRDAEPGTPSPQARLAAVRKLNDAGIPTGVMLAPIMPDLNDDREQLAALVDAAARAGATHITPIVLHLRPKVREVFWPWLAERHPELVGRYAALYRRSTAAPAYREEVERFVAAQRRAAWARHGTPEAPPQWRGRRAQRRPSVTADPTTGHPVAPGEGPDQGDGQLSLL
jgi:DNA repair photolyase